MRLQGKIASVIVFSLFLSALLSVVVINVFIYMYDKSYSKDDPEMIAEKLAQRIRGLTVISNDTVMSVFSEYQSYRDVFFFSYFEMESKMFVTTDFKHPPPPGSRGFNMDGKPDKRGFELEERKKFRFINFFNQMDFVIRKPVSDTHLNRGMIEVSVRKEYLFPFYLRINSEIRLQRTQ